MPASKMAQNIFRKYTGISRDEARRIVEGLPSQFCKELCETRPADAEQAVKSAYSKYLQALGAAAKATEIREVTPALAEEEYVETGTATDPGDATVEASGAESVEAGITEAGGGEDINPGLQ